MRLRVPRLSSSVELNQLLGGVPSTTQLARPGVSKLSEKTGAANIGSVLSALVPGAPTSTFLSPKFEKEARPSLGVVAALEELLAGSAFGQRVLSIKIWKPGGLIAYAADPDLIGQRFAPSEGLARALKGNLVAELRCLQRGDVGQRGACELDHVCLP